MKAPPYIANFDSASTALRATARFLRGTDFPAIGQSRLNEPLPLLGNLLPRPIREEAYSLGGWNEALPAHRIDEIDAEALSEWAVSRYPDGPFQGAVIGSTNGAAVHLCALFGLPWLPQTFLTPIRRPELDPDVPVSDFEWAIDPGARLLARNPDLQLHHMHDPNQDRLMLKYMTYFRVKRRTLGRAYERFLETHVQPGGTLFLLECTRKWPVKRIGPRQVFQMGAMGGLDPEEYLHGSARVADYLRRYDADRTSWEWPTPDAEVAEAEWGFAPALRADVLKFAAERGFRVQRIVFDLPEDLSPLVADLYRASYRRRNLVANRLLVEQFMLIEPFWALRTGSVPFWTKFPVEPSAKALERYLDQAAPYDEILAVLFSHGVESAGLAPLERWHGLLGRARRSGRLLGVDEDRFPRDFGVLTRYHHAIKQIPARYPIPPPQPVDGLTRFVETHGPRYGVRLEDPGVLHRGGSRPHAEPPSPTGG